jgi:hypothetical protein
MDFKISNQDFLALLLYKAMSRKDKAHACDKRFYDGVRDEGVENEGNSAS